VGIEKMPVDRRLGGRNISSPFSNMSSTSTETKQQTLKPEEIPVTSPQLMSRYITDTGKILPRKYTGMSAKQQRNVTKKIKRARKMLTMQ
jgi:small subunit ribosomal protein S18